MGFSHGDLIQIGYWKFRKNCQVNYFKQVQCTYWTIIQNIEITEDK